MFSEILLYFIIIILTADFLSGLAHWAEDTYCYKDILPSWLDRSICAPNLLHHEDQTKCLESDFLKTIKISTLISLVPGMVLLYYKFYLLGIAILISPMAAQTHIWCHSKSRFKIVRLLQDMCILQIPAHHSKHHRFPYTKNYCTMTNWLNPLLDGEYIPWNLWRSLESILKILFGLKVKQIRNKI